MVGQREYSACMRCGGFRTTPVTTGKGAARLAACVCAVVQTLVCEAGWCWVQGHGVSAGDGAGGGSGDHA